MLNIFPSSLPTADLEDIDLDNDQHVPVSTSSLLKSRLYTSHALSTFNDRVFEFASILFIVESFPNTLLPSSLYAIVRSAAAIALAPTLGSYVDNNERLRVVRNTIVLQRLTVLASSLLFFSLVFVLKDFRPLVRWVTLLACIILGSIERLCAIANTVAIENDWVVVIADGVGTRLETLNSQMRRIDLICKLLGPLLVSLIIGVDIRGCLLFIIVTNIVSVSIEYFAIAKVYTLCPALAAPKGDNSNQATARSSLITYVTSDFFLPSFALALLYLTVLSFGGTTTAYLISQDLTPTVVGLLRTISVIFEVSSTFIAPIVQRRIGNIRAGLWFINWQIFSVLPILLAFTSPHFDGKQKWVLAAMIPFSRIGLWGFDLCVRGLIQEGVPGSMRGTFSSTEAAFQNLFELLGYATTLIFFRPEQLAIPVAISVGSITLAGAVYATWVRKERGHLIHCYLEKVGLSDCRG